MDEFNDDDAALLLEDVEGEEPSGPGRGPLPVIAIVGRPNVGKSRIFNRMVGGRSAIVLDTPGVTRDRHYGRSEWYGKWYTVIDTGGFEPDSEDRILEQMRDQATLAIEEADAIMFVVDGIAGRLPGDDMIAQKLRESDKPIYVAVNKLDTYAKQHAAAEFYALGLPEVYPLSAEHGIGLDDIMDAITAPFPELGKADPDADADAPIRVAVVGKPNAGKSTLINRLLGTERLLTSNIPGTTRDSIDTMIERDGQKYLLIDTAGMRRKRSISMRLEIYSVVQAVKSIERADVVLLVVDATEGVTDQDAKIAGLAADRGAAIAILLNKWDAIETKDNTTYGEFIEMVRDKLKFIDYAPILTLSALTGQRSQKVLDQVDALYAIAGTRIPTGELNRVVEGILQRHKPPTHQNRTVRVYYASQVSVRPPTIIVQTNQPKGLSKSYRKYLLNQLRQAYDFTGTPIRLLVRKPKGRHRWSDNG